MSEQVNIQKFIDAVDECKPIKLTGKVTQIVGLVIESQGPPVSVGELCYVHSKTEGVPPVPAEVVGFREGAVMLMPVTQTLKGLDPVFK